MANNPLVSAWIRIYGTHIGIRICTDSHYVMLGSPKDRRPGAGQRATPDESLEALLTCPSLSGTYTVSGSRITQVMVANSRPELSNLPAIF